MRVRRIRGAGMVVTQRVVDDQDVASRQGGPWIGVRVCERGREAQGRHEVAALHPIFRRLVCVLLSFSTTKPLKRLESGLSDSGLVEAGGCAARFRSFPRCLYLDR